MRLQGRRLHDFGKSVTLGAADHLKDLRALAFGAGGHSLALEVIAFLLAFPSGLAAFFGAEIAALARCLAALAAVFVLGHALLLAGSLPGGSLLRRNVRALCRKPGGFDSHGGFCGRQVFGCPFLRSSRA